MAHFTEEQHRKAVDFVNEFKQANANTVQKVSSYDPIKKIWFLKTVKTDENAYKFAKETLKTEAQHRAAEKKGKGKNNIITRKSMSVEALRKMPTKPKSAMRLNVVRLRKEGKSFQEIADLYGKSKNSAKIVYHKEKITLKITKELTKEVLKNL